MAGNDFHTLDIVTSHFCVRRTQRGFTMVEMVVVIILVGILGAMGASRFFDRTGFDVNTFTAQATSLIRYGQKLAIAQNRSVFVQLDGSSVSLFVCTSGTPGNGCTLTAVPASSTAATSIAKPGNVSYSTSPSVTGFYFDSVGRPYAAGDKADDVFRSTFVRLTITVIGEGQTRTVTVTPETGYVY